MQYQLSYATIKRLDIEILDLVEEIQQADSFKDLYGAKNSDHPNLKFANTYWESIRQIFPLYGIHASKKYW